MSNGALSLLALPSLQGLATKHCWREVMHSFSRPQIVVAQRSLTIFWLVLISLSPSTYCLVLRKKVLDQPRLCSQLSFLVLLLWGQLLGAELLLQSHRTILVGKDPSDHQVQPFHVAEWELTWAYRKLMLMPKEDKVREITFLLMAEEIWARNH